MLNTVNEAVQFLSCYIVRLILSKYVEVDTIL